MDAVELTREYNSLFAQCSDIHAGHGVTPFYNCVELECRAHRRKLAAARDAAREAIARERGGDE